MAITRTVQLRTELPGPRSREILARKEQVVAEPLSVLLPIVVADTSGATLGVPAPMTKAHREIRP